jgi:molybdopterin-containing oxidoreductase family membrane subunit
MSVLFMMSAMVGGPSLTVLVSMLAGRLSRRIHVDDQLLNKVVSFISWTLVAYLYFRFWDAFAMSYTYEPGRTEGLHFLTQGPMALNFWVGEVLLGMLIPIILFFVPRFRRVPGLRMLALSLVVLGVVTYRWDTNLTGQLLVLSYLPAEFITRYTHYFPSLVEILAGAGVVAYGALAVTLGVRYLNIVDHRQEEHEEELTVELAPAD